MELRNIEDEDIIKFVKKETRQEMLSLEAADRLYALAKKAGEEKSVCLDIGSGIGCSGIIIGTAIKEREGKLISIDNFLTPPAKSLEEWGEKPWGPDVFRNNLKRFGIDPILIIGNSMEIIPLFEDKMFDLIWIDSCHEYESVTKDILNSIPKLKEGGILCGHDFRKRHDVASNCVKTVVSKIFGDNFKEIGGLIWVMNKETEESTGEVNRNPAGALKESSNVSDFSLEKLKKFPMPSQSVEEWQAYLEFIETYFRNRGIKKPMVVEIGVGRGRQKRFYEKLLGYDHIGIDFRRKKQPDIVGNSRDPITLYKLKKKLKGREVNLLFIDDGHEYSEVKGDYELYSPLAKNIIAIHDIVLAEHQNTVGKFWNELIAENRKSQDRIFITLAGYYPSSCHHYRSDIKRQFGQGTGLILIGD